MSSILILLVLILSISFLCSMLEAVFLSITPSYVALLLKDEKKYAKLVEKLKENIDRPISAILTLNTVSHTIGAAAIGARVQYIYGDDFVTLASVLLTLAILILSEIFPKIVGATYWKELTPFAAYTIQLMILILYPIVRLSEFLSMFLKNNDDTASVTREELAMSAEISADEGTINKKESLVIQNLLMMNSIYVSDIMTPRSVMFALRDDMTVEEVAEKYKPIRFSRIPVYHENLDQIIGLTTRYKILEALSNDTHDLELKNLVTEIPSISEKMSVSSVIDYFIKKKEHLAITLDEYGVVTGIVTLEDAIETLLGVEIVDEFDNITDMRQYALDQWQIRKKQNSRS